MQKPSFKEASLFWLKLGFISFGGPAGQVAIMHEYLVEKKKWISETKFLNALNYCMVLPGPEAQQLATYTGWMLHGTMGGLVAGLLFVLPSMFILLGLTTLYVSFGAIPWVYALFSGLKPAIIAIVLLALYKIGKKSLLSYFHYLVAFTAFVCIFFFHIPFPIIILGALLSALVLNVFYPKIFLDKSKNKTNEEADESVYYINKFTPQKDNFSWASIVKKLVVGCLLWLMPIVGLYFFTHDFIFWENLIVFFTKAALVTFGGAYAVLPYVAQVSVEKFHWLSNLQMMDGLALGETTPGPLIMVLVFVGFMAAYNYHQSSLLMGSLGLFVTTFYTFLFCFLFIFIGAPFIEKSQGNKKIGQLLSLVSAAVVGVILNLTLYLGQAVLFPKHLSFSGLDFSSFLWIIVSFLALYHFKINMILWIAISAVFGLTHFLVLG